MTWTFQLLDSEDRPLGALDGVTGGSCEIVAQSSLGGSGSLSLDERGQDIDWMSNRVRAWWHQGDVSWPVGTYLLTSPREQHTPFGVTFEVGLLTKMNVISRDAVLDRFSLPAGEPVIPAVVTLIQSTGEHRITATPSTSVLSSALTWKAGTSKLAIINDLLGAAGYWSLWCDGAGQFRVEPYVDPGRRSPAFTFEHGEASLHFPDWEREQDMTSVPNRVIAIGRGDEENPPMRGIAENNDPESPFSIPRRGVFVEVVEGVEGDTQDVFDQAAARKLADLMSPVSRLTVTHAMLDLHPNDLIAFIPEDGRRRLATVQRMQMSFTFDTDIDAEWREVT